MRRPFVIVMMLASIAGSFPASAQTRVPNERPAMAPRYIDPINGLSLDQAIARALAQEPGLRASRADVDVARGMSGQAALKPNPSVLFSQQMEPAGTDAQTRVEVQWPLDLFRKTGRVNVAERGLEVSQHGTADRERLLVSDVRMKYGEVLASVRELSIADELVAATARQREVQTARAEEGAIAPLERDMVRVELQRLEADRMLLAGHTEHALIELKRLVGLAADTPVALREDLEQLVRREISTDLQATDKSLTARPDIDEARARLGMAEARLDQVHREGQFDVSVLGMYMRSDSGFPQRGFGPEGNLERVRAVFHYWSAGVMVSLPLLDRKQGEASVAQAERARAQAQLEATQLTASAEIAAARGRDEHARQALAVYDDETKALARRNLDVVAETYEAGRLTLFDVLSERRRYLETERAYTNALREAYEARQALRTALGEVR